jgi:hypothetical protein
VAAGGRLAASCGLRARAVDRGKDLGFWDTRGERCFWAKIDGVYVAHEFKLRTWVPTFVIR